MHKKKSTGFFGSFQWSDEQQEHTAGMMKVEIARVASDLTVPIPIKIMHKKRDVFGSSQWSDEQQENKEGLPVRIVGVDLGSYAHSSSIPVRIVEIDRSTGRWDTIRVEQRKGLFSLP